MFATPYIPLMINESPHLSDDERMTMTLDERVTWCYGILASATALGYFAVVLPQLVGLPASQVQWQVPMLVAIIVVIVGTILAAIASSIVTAIANGGVDTGTESDIRDKQIDRLGERSTEKVTGFGLAIVIGLAMLDVDSFFIGNAAFAIGTLGAVWGAVVKIRAYRRSFA